MDEIIDGSEAESSAASTDGSATPPAAQLQGSQQAPVTPEPPFHQHPRFRELTSQNRELRNQITRLSQRMDQQSQSGSGAQNQPMNAEEQAAVGALKQLIARDPELKAILDAAKKAPSYDQRFQSMDQFQAQAARAHNTAARTSIKEMASSAGLPVDDASLRHIVRLVAGEAMAMEGGNDRYTSGDMSVLQEAFDAIKPWLSAMRKPAEQTVANTKNKTKQLPPPMRGAPAGEPAAPKVKEGQEREFEADMHKRASERLKALLQG